MKFLFNILFVFNFICTPVLADVKLLYEDVFSYGWRHDGSYTWGMAWHSRAYDDAREEIREKIATMDNLQELESFVKNDIKSAIYGKNLDNKDSASYKIRLLGEMPIKDMKQEMNKINFVIDIGKITMINGNSWFSRNSSGRRSWHATAHMRYHLKIYGNNGLQ